MEKNIHTNAILRLQKHRWRKTTDQDGYTEQSVQIRGNSGRKRLPGTGEEGAAVFAYAGDRYEECYREKTRRAGIWKRSCARLFGIGKIFADIPKKVRLYLKIRNTAGMIMDTTVL